jgi:hypothetical protein
MTVVFDGNSPLFFLFDGNCARGLAMIVNNAAKRYGHDVAPTAVSAVGAVTGAAGHACSGNHNAPTRLRPGADGASHPYPICRVGGRDVDHSQLDALPALPAVDRERASDMHGAAAVLQ